MAIASAAISTQTSDPWVQAVLQRRKALLQRLGMAAASALVFTPLIGWELSLAWVIGYFVIQGLDLWVFGPILDGKQERLTGLRALTADVVLLINASYFEIGRASCRERV